jgi:hypothetical protein
MRNSVHHPIRSGEFRALEPPHARTKPPKREYFAKHHEDQNEGRY